MTNKLEGLTNEELISKFRTETKDIWFEYREELLRRLGASGVPRVDDKEINATLQDLATCFADDRNPAMSERTRQMCQEASLIIVGLYAEMKRLQEDPGASGVDVREFDLNYVYNALITSSDAGCTCEPGSEDGPCPACEANHASAIIDRLRKHIAQPAAPEEK